MSQRPYNLQDKGKEGNHICVIEFEFWKLESVSIAALGMWTTFPDAFFLSEDLTEKTPLSLCGSRLTSAEDLF